MLQGMTEKSIKFVKSVPHFTSDLVIKAHAIHFAGKQRKDDVNFGVSKTINKTSGYLIYKLTY
jgi:hypothetical protein